ncbi:glycosyltransferase family 4 protein [Elstera litoralis]|uniref:glycosyltransferase family 4 protein n=1 Tax=Elstera litoralis TaxID=552518 RepID=UPI0006971294|nr:glycosyltransferase family 4 protein [Elstera litoralis]
MAFAVLPGAWLDRLGKRWQALIHHPLCLETGLDPARALSLRPASARPWRGRNWLSSPAGRRGATLTARFAVPADKILLAPPGVTRYRRSAPRTPPMILTVGAISPRKNFDGLVTALDAVRDLPWTATIVGSDAHSPETGAALRAQVAALGLTDRVHLPGALTGPALETAYAEASFYVHAAHYEGFGMALADALASGLPTVASIGGAVGDWLPEGAALRATPDAATLAENMRLLLTDSDLAERLAAAGRAIDFPTWLGAPLRLRGLGHERLFRRLARSARPRRCGRAG